MRFDFDTYTKDFISEDQLKEYTAKVSSIKDSLGKGDMLGWYNLDNLFNEELVEDINLTSLFVRNNCDVFIVIGIGGSYLGALAGIEALNPYFYNETNNPKIYFVGNNLSSDYYHDLINIIKDKRIIVNVISKSGSTLETLVSYKIIMDLMKEKYDESELKKRIIITTDEHNGSLREEVNIHGYKSFIMPSDIGGRYSVLSPVGLLPMAVSNINIRNIYKGAKEASNNLDNQIKYAVIRKLINEQGKTVEAYVAYEPKLYAFTEWLKQLYGESLGKNEQGILPVSFINTRDLHSLGQFVQQGNKILFETVLNVERSNNDLELEQYKKSLNDINNIASKATSIAHLKGGVLNNVINIQELNEELVGYLFQFFMISCYISGFLENVNPFDQEGVEEYKNVMKELMN
ncbi:MAG: glucose-6-phosphate isomerase [Bacilli bacterium]|nr:glucose-6-phosphate isomerase [Bacilli bacterium]MDD3305273.1 glucose-6-phosphate isomerase [Bacilli bacterium]MDD4053727.1 glucose-6-phosphate isomerase [Bacilli bacterium]MDD4411612.1 glucose-6-phosphate isomerase [Bacilli bacterium]